MDITLDDLLRAHGNVCGKDILVTMVPCPIMDVDPSDFHEVLPDAVPVTRASDDLNVSGASAIPGRGAAGAVGRSRHTLRRGAHGQAQPLYGGVVRGR